MADLTNGFANFKGVMLCQRPVDKAERQRKTVYCFTTTDRSELGVNPNKIRPRRERRRVVKALVDHKRWLETLKSEVRDRKERTLQDMLQDEARRSRIKENSKKAREFIHEGQTDKVPDVYPHFDLSIRSKSAPKEVHHLAASQDHPIRVMDEGTQTTPGIRQSLAVQRTFEPEPAETKAFKKKKPAWALTAAEQEDKEQAEVDDLLNFMDRFDASQFAEDVQVRELIANLEKRVGELKKEDNWKENWEKRLKERRKKKEEEYLKEKASKAVDDDMIAYNGDNSSQLGIAGGSLGSRGEAKTVLSEKTQGRLFSFRIDKEYQGKDGSSKPRQRRLEQKCRVLVI